MALKVWKKRADRAVSGLMNRLLGNGLMQELNTASGEKYVTPDMPELVREAGDEGIVLLKNEGDLLPLGRETELSVFGRCQYDWFYVGYGSGGDVHPPYRVNLIEGIRANDDLCLDERTASVYEEWISQEENRADDGWWGHWPFHYDEMRLSDELVREAAGQTESHHAVTEEGQADPKADELKEKNHVAAVVIGRAAGEDRENILEKGSYYLTDDETEMLDKVCESFDRVVLIMNCGSIMDLSWIEKYPSIRSVLYVWQLGQESGNAVADVLSGRVNPSGHLTDTVAWHYEDYPSSSHFGNSASNMYAEGIFVGYRYFETKAKDKVQYPFGYGLSYTTFSCETLSCDHEKDPDGGDTVLRVRVKNTGSRPGKEAVQIYCRMPEGALDKAERNLVGFRKTKLLQPGEEEEITFRIKDYTFASYDADGRTGHKSCYVLEAGTYLFYVGDNVRDAKEAGSFDLPELKVLQQLEPVLTLSPKDLRKRILERMPKAYGRRPNRGLTLGQVKKGEISLEEFMSQLTDKELCDLTRGEGGMRSALGTEGNAGVFGGITEDLRSKGIPPLVTCDGPSGIRLQKYATLLPVGTALACTWNTELLERLFGKMAEEMEHYHVDVLLSPGMNIHRNPLCGRNFEYYSEDPYLTGKTAAAVVRGIQSRGASACPKHFACNNQETNRNRTDSVVDERTLREIYLKGFEIMVKEASPDNLMTSYNKLNGVWNHYNYDLVTTVLRGEWGYQGNVMTDWWMQMGRSLEFPAIENNAYRVRAGVDVFMPGNFSPTKPAYKDDASMRRTMGQKDGLTRGELERCAGHVLRFALKRLEDNV